MGNIYQLLLKEARIHFNLTLSSLANILNISKENLNQIESGNIPIPRECLKYITFLINLYLEEKEKIYPTNLLQRFIYFYDVVTPLSTVINTQPIGNKYNRICRYCGKTKNNGKFKKIAHTFPVSIGNKTLFSYDECDDCNELFCTYEDALGKYTNLERVLSWTPTRNGMPKLKMTNDLGMAFENDEMLHVHIHFNSKSFEIDENNNSVLFKHKFTYIPQYIYKILYKMALSIMPYDELNKFTMGKLWLINKCPLNILSNNIFSVIKTFIPGPRPCHNHIFYALFKRVSPLFNVPYMMFFVAFSNFAYQVPLAFSSEDGNKISKEMMMPLLPLPKILYNTNYGPVSYKFENFTSKERTTSQPFVRIHYDKLIKQKPPLKVPNKILYK